MIIYPNNKTCTYEVEYKKDCADSNFERTVKKTRENQWGDEEGEW
jgi:hypothetical protein